MSPITKRRLKMIARVIGLRMRLGVPVRRNMSSFSKHLARLGFRPETIIDVGVADGTTELYDPFPTSRLLLVEPVIEFEPAIANLLRRYDGDVVWAAAGSTSGTLEIAAGPDIGSLHNAVAATNGGREVPVRRLDEIAADASGPILLKIDVEGFELEVMRGATGIMNKVEVAILETRLFNVTGGIPILHEVVEEMAKWGFVVYDILETVARPLDGALILCDLVYMKADSQLRADPQYASQAQIQKNEKRFAQRLRKKFKF